MKLPDEFSCGRFKLESFYVNYLNDHLSDIIMNGITFMILEEGSARDIYDKLSRGEKIKARLRDGRHVDYIINIEDKEWVYIEKM